MLVLRSLLFNLVFYVWTMLCCVGLLWMLFIPRRRMIDVLAWYMRTLAWLERTIIGLHYEVRGLEHLPTHGSFLVGAKHQSMWETMKLHLILDDPAIILKRELLWLPIWGWYAAKSQQIPVDRSRRGAALSPLVTGARAVAAQGRPIVIFPQGTRLAPGTYRPYKVGIGVLYQDLDLPIVPMALNSGLFWGRRTIIRRPGTITIEFLPPIPPGLPRDVAMAELEERLETASERLSLAAGGPPTERPTTPRRIRLRTVARARGQASA
ncbi:lysophospholipid acyltransferase family protein [Rhodospirillum centenum]|uniref:Acyltransferase, putative n=1 Tax=Rhodospirillum centenum (strain ATCC 51521 / SW) TaxID=414684 RepID=B6IYR0_RHOCS|nr:lysophospholipid acyltransferase family protein [Rhodospirillum centenum]ACJ01434.1 acyltransferase, putative [Rhodospirillum centenum SW]